MFNRKRSDLEVVADILRIKGSKTAIMYGANLSYAQTQKYLGILTEREFLESVVVRSGRREYHPTEKAQELLRMIETIEELVRSPDPVFAL